MKNVLFILMLIGFVSCAKQERSEVLTTSLHGTLKCINSNPLDGITVDAIDDSGTVKSTTTNALGEFVFDDLDAGNYQVHARTSMYYSYTDAEYDSIITDLWDIVLGVRTANNQDKIAYHMIDFHNNLTTYDIVFFQKLKELEYNIADNMPWRLIKMDDFTSGNIYAADVISVVVNEDIVNNIDILAIYAGDPFGLRCQ